MSVQCQTCHLPLRTHSRIGCVCKQALIHLRIPEAKGYGPRQLPHVSCSEQSQGDTSIYCPAVAGEEHLLACGSAGSFTADHWPEAAYFLSAMLSSCKKNLANLNQELLHFEVLVDIDVGDHIGRDAECVIVIQEVAIVITALRPSRPIRSVYGRTRPWESTHRSARSAPFSRPDDQISGRRADRKIDVLGVNVRIGPGKSQAGHRPPIVKHLDPSILRESALIDAVLSSGNVCVMISFLKKVQNPTSCTVKVLCQLRFRSDLKVEVFLRLQIEVRARLTR